MFNVYQLSIFDKGNIVYKKYYSELNQTTRNSYITYLKRVVKEYHLLDNIKFFSKDYIERDAKPWDDDFTFMDDHVQIFGTTLNKYFYEYNFSFNGLTYSMFYTADDRKSREEFITEVYSFLRYENQYSLIETLNRDFKSFRSIDNDILSVKRLEITQLKDY